MLAIPSSEINLNIIALVSGMKFIVLILDFVSLVYVFLENILI